MARAILDFQPMLDRPMPGARAPNRAECQRRFDVRKAERQLAGSPGMLNLLQPPRHRERPLTHPGSVHQRHWHRPGKPVMTAPSLAETLDDGAAIGAAQAEFGVICAQCPAPVPRRRPCRRGDKDSRQKHTDDFDHDGFQHRRPRLQVAQEIREVISSKRLPVAIRKTCWGFQSRLAVPNATSCHG